MLMSYDKMSCSYVEPTGEGYATKVEPRLIELATGWAER